jgi:hypothetical protein
MLPVPFIVAPVELADPLAERLVRPMGADPHGGLRRPEAICDHGVGEMLEPVEPDDVALVLGKARERCSWRKACWVRSFAASGRQRPLRMKRKTGPECRN